MDCVVVRQRGPSRNNIGVRTVVIVGPLSPVELAEEAVEDLVWSDNLSVRHYINLAERYRREGEAYARQGDTEEAFVQLAKAVFYIPLWLPRHKDYYTHLTESQREDIVLSGNETIFKLAQVGSVLWNQYDRSLQEDAARIRRELEATARARQPIHNSVHSQYSSPAAIPSQSQAQRQSAHAPPARFRLEIEELSEEERVPQQERVQRRSGGEQPETRATRIELSRTTPNANNRRGSIGAVMPLSTAHFSLHPDPPSADNNRHDNSSSASDEYSSASSRTESTDFGIYCRRMAFEYSRLEEW